MTLKNNYTLRTLSLFCIIILSCCSSLQIYTQQEITQKVTPSPTIDQKESTDESGEITKKPEPKKKIISTTKQPTTPTHGLLTRMYLAVTPIILVTLNQALGTGIAAATKSLIKQFMTRQTFTLLKKDILEKAKTLVEEGTIDKTLQSTYAGEGISVDVSEIPYEIKFDLAKNTLFRANKINDPDLMEKQISLPSMLGQATYIGMLNTVIPMIGTLIGLGATMTFQTLMPADNR